MKVAMLTTVGDRCGIAAYTRSLVGSLGSLADVAVEPILPGQQPAEHYRDQASRLNAADLIHIQHEHSFWGGLLPGRSSFWVLRYMLEKPVVITAHTTSALRELLDLRNEKRPLRRLAKELLTRHPGYRQSVEIAPFVTGRCIVHTEAGRQALVGRGAHSEYVHVIPAGVPRLPPAPTGGEAFRDRYGLRDRRVVSIFGYVTPNKGYELTMQALPELPPEVTLVVAGGPRTPADEAYAERVRQAAREAGIESRVVVTGVLSDEDVAEAMAASEVVLAPHTYATGSYSITVPLAYGRPVVASNLPCFQEIQDRVPCMRLFRSGDAGHYAACVKAVLGNPLGRQEMSERALRYAAEQSWDAVARRTLDVYQAAMADSAAGTPAAGPSRRPGH